MKVGCREEKAAQPQFYILTVLSSASMTNMQSLLSQSESNAFQSFLSSMDYIDDAIPADEWVAFSATSGDPSYSDNDSSEGRQALRKATKDLMSLDTDANWDNPNDSLMNHGPVIHPHFDGHETQAMYNQQQGHRYQQVSSRHDIFPFLHTKSQHQQPIQFPMQLQQHPPVPAGSPGSQQRSPISTPSSYGFSQQQLHRARAPQQQPEEQRGRTRDTSAESNSKRSHTISSTSAQLSRSSDPPHKRPRLSVSQCQSSTPATTSIDFSGPGHSSSSIPQSGPQQQQASKPNLLSPSQKKANHIQSEQKRRANIRKGYQALCETVPALREAIREEEEAERLAANTIAMVNGVGIDGVNTNGSGKKKRSKKGINGKDLDERDKDKIDGRAGPRSENVVLSKSMHALFLSGFQRT